MEDFENEYSQESCSSEDKIDTKDFDTNIALIEAVENRPALYQPQSEEHKDRNLKDKLWREVASAVNKDVKWCIKKWKSLKGYYYIKKREMVGKSGQGGRKSKPWALYPSMQFLDGIVSVNPETRTNLNDDSVSQDEYNSTQSNEEGDSAVQIDEMEDVTLNGQEHRPYAQKESAKQYKPPQKRAKKDISEVDQTIIRLLSDEPDKDASHHFCMSLADRLRKLTDVQRGYAEFRLMQTMYEVEYSCFIAPDSQDNQ